MIGVREWDRDGYQVSTNPDRLQVDVIHSFLAGTYWAPGIPREVVVRCIAGSLPFGLYHGAQQVGFARVISDLATFAYLADVFVLESHRGRGLARWMMECILQTPELQGLRRWLLVTRDAHALYRAVGFVPASHPENVMEIVRRDIYLAGPAQGDHAPE
jgi:GNAT superfamily N-acetyltransferase